MGTDPRGADPAALTRGRPGRDRLSVEPSGESAEAAVATAGARVLAREDHLRGALVAGLAAGDMSEIKDGEHAEGLAAELDPRAFLHRATITQASRASHA